MDPGNQEATDLEVKILKAQKRRDEAQEISTIRSVEGEAFRKEEEEKAAKAAREREDIENESKSTYRSMLRRAWADGKPNNEERSMLALVRRSFGLSDDDQALLEREVQLEAYTDALRSAMKAGIIAAGDKSSHDNFRELYGIRIEDHLTIEAALLREFQKTG